jgi:hypothetical protein
LIYICIPTHNEQQTVGVVLWKLRQVLTDYPRDYQLLVADDGSTDKTAAVLEPYTRVLPLTVIRSEKQLGTAAATEMLLREAVRRSEYPKRDVIVTLQADFSEEPDDIVALIKRMEAGADVAIGNKVSVTKPTRSRIWARKLATFFARGQKWPEGLTTPFESYRAYRLYAIKNAMEERKGRRLLCHAGWAGQAELLKAVMPHARRVDVVDVDDRLDRMQRPRRERPFAAAFEVRSMAKGAEPASLVSVEELDRLASSGSRTRERGSLVAEAAAANANGRAAASRNGHRSSRDQRPSGRDRDRSRSGSSEPRGRGRRPEGEEQKQAPRAQRPAAQQSEPPTSRGRGRNRAAAAATEGAEERPQQPRRQPSQPSRPPAEPPVAAAEIPGITPEAGEAKPKRRRRRRKRGGGAQSAAAAAGGQEAASEEAGDDAGPLDSGDEPAVMAEGGDQAGETAGGEKKRRRRGGRRGGRGRRRGPKPEGSEGSAQSAAEGGFVEEGGGGTSSPPAGAEQET